MAEFNEILLLLVNNNLDNKYLILFLFLSIFLLSTPFPITLVIILNVYIFDWYGLVISMLAFPIGSLLTYFYVKNLKKIFLKIPFFKKYLNTTNIIPRKFYQNIYLLIIARATLPFFLVSLAMAILDISKKQFIMITLLGQTHYVLITSIFVHGIRETIIDYNDIVIEWSNPLFFIPIILIIILIFISKLIKERYQIKF